MKQQLPLPEETWSKLPPEVQVLINTLLATIHRLEKRVEDLEAQVNKNSRNSSKPPSSDAPWLPPVKRKPRGGRRNQGGQAGHEGHFRALAPVESVDHLIEHYPGVCDHCGDGFKDDAELDGFGRHQVSELRPIVVEVTEHRLHGRRCDSCHNTTRATLPAAVSYSSFGPRAQATIAMLTGRYRISRREASQLASDLFGLHVSTGAIITIEQKMAAALTGPCNDVLESLRRQPVLNADETPWSVAGGLHWLWTFVSPSLAYFRITSTRSTAEVWSMLGTKFLGFLGCDRYTAYSVVPLERRGSCHAHLIRNFQDMVERKGESKRVGDLALAVEKQVFKLWYKRQNNDISQEIFETRMEPLKERLRAALLSVKTLPQHRTSFKCNGILKMWDSLWNFVTVPGLEPTNNASEQALRKAVLWRKGSFGSQSSAGNEYVQNMLTAAETCRRQGRHLLQFLCDTVSSAITGERQPSLLPADACTE